MAGAMRRHRHGNGPKTDSNAIGCISTLAESPFSCTTKGRRLSAAQGRAPTFPSISDRWKDSGFFVKQARGYAKFRRRRDHVWQQTLTVAVRQIDADDEQHHFSQGLQAQFGVTVRKQKRIERADT